MIKLTEELSGLYQGYPGDHAWEKFVVNFPEIDESVSEFIPLDNDMARVIYKFMSNNLAEVESYLKYKVPRLDEYTPIEVFSLPEGRLILRSALMRMK